MTNTSLRCVPTTRMSCSVEPSIGPGHATRALRPEASVLEKNVSRRENSAADPPGGRDQRLVR